jgi:hypothetical protein
MDTVTYHSWREINFWSGDTHLRGHLQDLVVDGTGHLQDLVVDGTVMWCVRIWTGFFWLMILSISGPLWIRQWICGFHTKRTVSPSTDCLSESQERLCAVELLTFLVSMTVGARSSTDNTGNGGLVPSRFLDSLFLLNRGCVIPFKEFWSPGNNLQNP